MYIGQLPAVEDKKTGHQRGRTQKATTARVLLPIRTMWLALMTSLPASYSHTGLYTPDLFL